MEIILSAGVGDTFRRMSCEALPFETGGVLLGVSTAEAFIVTRVVGPGPKAIHKIDFFLRDGDYAQAEFGKVYDLTNGECTYLGEWHSHPLPVPLSSDDVDSMKSIAADPKCCTPEPILVLLVRVDEDWHIHGYQVHQGDIRNLEVKERA